MTPSISKAISATRFPIILGPVMIHCQSIFEATTYRLFWGEMVGRITVPLFFIIAGYLYFQKFDGSINAYKSKLRKRFRSLLLPYLLWNLLAFLFYWRVGIAEVSSFFSSFWVVPYHSGHSPADGPLWFLRTLILLQPFTPMMYFINKRKWFCWISVILYMLLFLNTGIFRQGMVIGCICFNLGAFFALSGCESKILRMKNTTPRNTHIFVLIVFLIFVIACICDYSSRAEDSFTWGIFHWTVLTSGGMLIMYIPYFNGAHLQRVLQSLGKTSFFIFCFHEPIIPYISAFITSFGYYGNIGYTITIILDVILCLLAYWSINKISPSVLAILNGGR